MSDMQSSSTTNTLKKIHKFILISLYPLTLGVLLYFFLSTSGSLFFRSVNLQLIMFGRLFGFVAAFSALWQVFLMSRARFFESVFGLDKLARVHRVNGYVTLITMLLHPIFLVVGNANISKATFFAQYVRFLTDYEAVLRADIGLILFIIVVVSSIYIVRRKLRYEYWYWIHLMTYLAIILAFGHQIKIGSDLLENANFYYYWVALYVLVAFSVLYYRFTRPIYNLAKYKFKVTSVAPENDSITSVYIKWDGDLKFNILPGQFVITRFLCRGFWYEAHPFSISKMPVDNTFRLSIKNLGDFTSKITSIPVGTYVYLDGPYGVFTENVCNTNQVTLIAGGIGITPIRTLIERFCEHGKKIVVYYANKTYSDVVFKSELDNLRSQYNFDIHYVYSNEKDAVECGFVDESRIARLTPDIINSDVYICGPPKMLSQVRLCLTKLGVPKQNIHFELFSL